MGIANHAPRGGIDEVNVPAHQFGERSLGPALGVIAQKLLVAQIVHARNQIMIWRMIKIMNRVSAGASTVRFERNSAILHSVLSKAVHQS